jgi:membrane-associated phospholipid phosphatase
VKDIFKANLSFLVPYFIFLCCGAVLIAINSKAATHLEFNAFHSFFFDIFFTYVTYLGDGVTALLVVIILLTVKFRYALFVGLANLVSTLITQLLKHTFFSDVVRPKKFFEGVHDLYLVSGVNNYLYHSFPSGHSTSAFSLCFALALLAKNKNLKFALFVIALLIGYSRIYLSQHFLEDVFAGSLIGVTITALVFLCFKDNKRTSLDDSLITVFKRQ